MVSSGSGSGSGSGSIVSPQNTTASQSHRLTTSPPLRLRASPASQYVSPAMLARTDRKAVPPVGRAVSPNRPPVHTAPFRVNPVILSIYRQVRLQVSPPPALRTGMQMKITLGVSYRQARRAPEPRENSGIRFYDRMTGFSGLKKSC